MAQEYQHMSLQHKVGTSLELQAGDNVVTSFNLSKHYLSGARR